MKAFKFRLESILTLRKAKSAQAIEAYAKASQKTQDFRSLVEQLDKREFLLNQLLKSSRDGTFQGKSQELFLYSIHENRQNLLHITKLLADAVKEEAQQLQAYINTKKEEKILVNLKDKKSSIYRKEFQIAEDLSLEDLVHAKLANR